MQSAVQDSATEIMEPGRLEFARLLGPYRLDVSRSMIIHVRVMESAALATVIITMVPRYSGFVKLGRI